MYYGIDAAVKYSFMNLINSKVVDPSHLWWLYFFGTSFGTVNPGAGLTFGLQKMLTLTSLQKALEIEKMLQEPDYHLIFNILQVLLSNLEEKILTVMESMIKMMLVQKLLV
jgi:hypothetical protein